MSVNTQKSEHRPKAGGIMGSLPIRRLGKGVERREGEVWGDFQHTSPLFLYAVVQFYALQLQSLNFRTEDYWEKGLLAANWALPASLQACRQTACKLCQAAVVGKHFTSCFLQSNAQGKSLGVKNWLFKCTSVEANNQSRRCTVHQTQTQHSKMATWVAALTIKVLPFFLALEL